MHWSNVSQGSRWGCPIRTINSFLINRNRQGMPQTLFASSLCNVSAQLLKHIPVQVSSEGYFLSLPQFWPESHDSFCILFTFASTVQICIVHIYPLNRSGTNEVDISKLISLLRFCMSTDKLEAFHTSLEHDYKQITEETGSISDVVQMLCKGG